jgi:hypothetical protein
LSDQSALADALPQTEARLRFEEGAAALEIQLATGVYRVVQGTFRLQGSDLKMQVAFGVQDSTLKSRNRNNLLNHIRKCLMFALNLMRFCLSAR